MKNRTDNQCWRRYKFLLKSSPRKTSQSIIEYYNIRVDFKNPFTIIRKPSIGSMAMIKDEEFTLKKETGDENSSSRIRKKVVIQDDLPEKTNSRKKKNVLK